LEGLQARIDPAEMRRLGVYATPGLGSDAHFGNDLLRHEVAFHFPRLRDYVRRTSDKGNGLLVWID
jgi:hypothetical protein